MAYCTNCGKQVEDTDRFCAACGSPRRLGVPEATPSAALPAARPLTEAASPPPAWTTAAQAPAATSYADWSEPSSRAGVTPSGEAWERITTRAGWAVAGLIVVMLGAGFSIIAYINEITLLADLDAGIRVPLEDLEASDSLLAAAEGLGFLGVVFAAVTFLMWLHLAWVNVERRSLTGVRWSASWAVGWWFIPFMNLFRPYQVMQTLWRASQQPADQPGSTEWAVRSSTPLLAWWWALYLAGFLIDGAFAELRGDDSIDFAGWIALDVFVIFGIVGQIASAFLAILIVRRITAMHERLRTGA